MKCNYCKMEWNGPTESLSTVKECPFCHKPLRIINDTAEMSFGEVLIAIAQQGGIEALENGRTLLSYFSDYAPNRVREKRLLRALIECRGNVILLNAEKGNTEISAAEQVIRKLTIEYSLAENAAREVCDAFLSAISEPKSKREAGVENHSQISKNDRTIETTSVVQAIITSPDKPQEENEIRIDRLVSAINEKRLGDHVDWPILLYGDDDFQRLLRNAERSYFPSPIDINEQPILLFDYTIFKSGKDGFVLTTERVVSKVLGVRKNIPFNCLVCFQESKKYITIQYFHKGGSLDSHIITAAKSEDDAKSFCAKMNWILGILMGDLFEHNLDRAIGAIDNEIIGLNK